MFYIPLYPDADQALTIPSVPTAPCPQKVPFLGLPLAASRSLSLAPGPLAVDIWWPVPPSPFTHPLWPAGPQQTQAASLPWAFLPPGSQAQQALEGRGDPAHSWLVPLQRLTLGWLPHLSASPRLCPKQGLRAAQVEPPAATTTSLLPTSPPFPPQRPLSPKVSGSSSLPLPSTPTSCWWGHRTYLQHWVTRELADEVESLAHSPDLLRQDLCVLQADQPAAFSLGATLCPPLRRDHTLLSMSAPPWSLCPPSTAPAEVTTCF